MTVVTVSGDEPDEQDESGHAAAVAQGRAEAHAEQAEQAADDAAAQADEVEQLAQLAAETAAQASEAHAGAQAAAEDATTARDAVLVAMEAQTAAINELVTELRESRAQAQAPAVQESEGAKQTPDNPPEERPKRKHWYY